MQIGLIGHPVAHSRSPDMQNAAFAAVGMTDWKYELWDTTEAEIPQRISRMRKSTSIAGANVTVPHKQNVMAFLDSVSGHARSIGAVNTIVKRDGRLRGDNTDWIGFLNDMRWHGIEATKIEHAVVLGAGGSARAVVYALASSGVSVLIVNRDETRAQQLADDMRALRLGANRPFIEASSPRRFVHADTPEPQLVVNCTSAGMWPNENTSPWPPNMPFPAGAVLYDLVYKPRTTKLMRDAATAGLRVVGGIGMLAEQGAASFEMWTGVPSSRVIGVMRDAILGG